MKDIPLPHRAVRDGNGFGLPIAIAFVAGPVIVVLAVLAAILV